MVSPIRGFLSLGVWVRGLALFSVYLVGLAQTASTGGKTFPGGGVDFLRMNERLAARAQPETELFFEGTIDPADYIVGPGDEIRLSFWSPTFTESSGQVSAEGFLVVPYVGAVRVADLSLNDARAAIERAVQRTFREGRLSVTLARPRKFRVHVTGSVMAPGTYVVPATARVADAVVEAGGFLREKRLASLDTTADWSASPRQIELRDRDGRRAGHADLLLFLHGGMLKHNPLLRDGYTIYVRPYDSSGPRIAAHGAVYGGGVFEYVPGDRVAELLALAGGLTPQADSSSLLLVSADGQRRELNLRDSDDAALETPLKAGDRIYVTGRPDTSRLGSVTLTGEIAKPGGYPIVDGVTSLREVLGQAGGVLPSAALNSVRLIRNSSSDPAVPERNRIMAATVQKLGYPTLSADSGLAVEFARWNYGTAVIDLSQSDWDAALRLRDGDHLDIPRQSLGVRVFGAVANGGEVPWESGKRVKDYVALAGGPARNGWVSRAVVVKARNGAQVPYRRSLPIDPGDIIYIPPKQEWTVWARFKDVLSVTAQVATVVLIAQNIGK